MQKSFFKYFIVIVILALLVFGGFTLLQHNALSKNKVYVGVVYTSGCTIGNISREDPASFNTLQKQIDYCNSLENNDAGVFLYDFAKGRIFEIDELKRDELQNFNLMDFPKQNILGHISTTLSDIPYDSGFSVEIEEFDIECAAQQSNEGLQKETIGCSIISQETEESYYSFGKSEIIIPHFYLAGDDYTQLKKEIIK